MIGTSVDEIYCDKQFYIEYDYALDRDDHY